MNLLDMVDLVNLVNLMDLVKLMNRVNRYIFLNLRQMCLKSSVVKLFAK